MTDDRDGWLGELFRSHHRSLVVFLGRMAGGAASAEDVAQEAYLRLAGRGAGALAVDHPKTYLFATARNAAFDAAARIRTEQRHRSTTDRLPEVESPEPPPDHTVHHRRRLECMAAALNELPSATRQAFVMSKLHGLDHRTIAGRLGVSRSMVEKHIMRALAHCRDRLADGGR